MDVVRLKRGCDLFVKVYFGSTRRNWNARFIPADTGMEQNHGINLESEE